MISESIDEIRNAIRAARTAINDAIDRRDPEGIAAYFLPSYHVVTARSMQRYGREDSVKSWEQMFAKDPTARYGRFPEEIHVNAGWGHAHEEGRWTGTLLAMDGPMELAGVYTAKWHNTEEGWRLQAEIFTALEVTRDGK